MWVTLWWKCQQSREIVVSWLWQGHSQLACIGHKFPPNGFCYMRCLGQFSFEILSGRGNMISTLEPKKVLYWCGWCRPFQQPQCRLQHLVCEGEARRRWKWYQRPPSPNWHAGKSPLGRLRLSPSPPTTTRTREMEGRTHLIWMGTLDRAARQTLLDLLHH